MKFKSSGLRFLRSRTFFLNFVEVSYDFPAKNFQKYAEFPNIFKKFQNF